MITLIIPAWKEQLDVKLRNLEWLQMPENGLQIIIICSESLVLPPGLAERGFRLHVVLEQERKGKAVAINEAMKQVDTPLVIFHDANTELQPDSILHLCKPFSDPTIGGVAGEKRVQTNRNHPGALEGYYWKYESAWKRQDANFYSVIGGAGELFAIRTELFEPLPADCILDDLELSWQVISKGYRIAYAPQAVTTEPPSGSLKDESIRKIRIATGAYQFLDRHSLLSIFRVSFRYGLQFLLRKWLRWVIWPLLTLSMPLILLVALWSFPEQESTRLLSFVVGGILTISVIGGLLSFLRVRVGWLGIPFYFLFIQYCQIQGWFRYHLGNPTVLWEKSDRSRNTLR